MISGIGSRFLRFEFVAEDDDLPAIPGHDKTVVIAGESQRSGSAWEFDREHFVAGRGVPDSDRAVAAGSRQASTVGREGEAPDPIRMTNEVDEFLAALEIPESGIVIAPGGGNLLSIRRKSDGEGP